MNGPRFSGRSRTIPKKSRRPAWDRLPRLWRRPRSRGAMASPPWQGEASQAIQMLQERLQVDFPELHITKRGDAMIVAGVFPLVDGERVVDRFLIELELPRTYPKG